MSRVTLMTGLDWLGLSLVIAMLLCWEVPPGAGCRHWDATTGSESGVCVSGSPYGRVAATSVNQCARSCIERYHPRTPYDTERCVAAQYNSLQLSDACELYGSFDYTTYSCSQHSYFLNFTGDEILPTRTVDLAELIANTPAIGTCPPAWFQLGSQCYLYVGSTLTFNKADTYCRQRSATLVSLGNEGENAFVGSLIPPVAYPRSVYIGMLKQGNSYLWTDRSRLVYYNWMTSEPDDNPVNANCIAMSEVEPHQWEDVTCDEEKNFICEASTAALEGRV